MSASERMAGLVEAFGKSVMAAPAAWQAKDRLLAAIGELERDRDDQAERLAAFDSCDRARQAAEVEVAALKAEVARLAALALEACDGWAAQQAMPDDAVERLRSVIPTPDPAAFVAALDAYGAWCGTIGSSLATGGTPRFLADCERERDTYRAALLKLGGVR